MAGNPLLTQEQRMASSGWGVLPSPFTSPRGRGEPRSKRVGGLGAAGRRVAGLAGGKAAHGADFMKSLRAKTVNVGGKVLSELDTGKIVVDRGAAVKTAPAAPRSAAGLVVSTSELKNFLEKVAGDVAERPRKTDIFVYLVALVSVTSVCLLNVSLDKERLHFEMQRSLELGLFGTPMFWETKPGTFMEVEDGQEFWTWMEGPFVSVVWGGAVGAGGTRYVLDTNYIIGPVVLRQLRSALGACEALDGLPDTLVQELYRDGCMSGGLSDQPFGPGNKFIPDSARADQSSDWGTLKVPMVNPLITLHRVWQPTSRAFSTLVPSQYSPSQALTVIQQMKNGSWFDMQTRMVIIEAIVFNRHLNGFCTVQAWIEVTPTGHYVPSHRLQPFELVPLSTGAGKVSLTIDIVLFLVAAVGSARLIRKIWHVWLIRRSPIYMVTFWNIIQILVFVVLCYASASRFYLFYKTETIGEAWPRDSSLASPGVARQWNALMSFSWYFHTDIQVLAYCGCLVWLWGLSFLEHMPKLALLTETVHSAFSELFGVMVLLAFMMMGFSIMTSLLYGRSIDNFSTFFRSMSTLLQIALDFGNLEYVTMEYLEPKMTSFVLIVFTFLVWVLILNMLLAVITEAFVRTARVKRNEERLSMQMMVRGAITHLKKTLRKANVAVRRFLRMKVDDDGEEEQEVDDKALHGALFGSVDEMTVLQVEYFRTVSNTRKLLLLAAAVNALAHWREREHGEDISFEEVKRLPKAGSDPPEPVQFTDHQRRLLEEFFIHRGRTPTPLASPDASGAPLEQPEQAGGEPRALRADDSQLPAEAWARELPDAVAQRVLEVLSAVAQEPERTTRINSSGHLKLATSLDGSGALLDASAVGTSQLHQSSAPGRWHARRPEPLRAPAPAQHAPPQRRHSGPAGSLPRRPSQPSSGTWRPPRAAEGSTASAEGGGGTAPPELQPRRASARSSSPPSVDTMETPPAAAVAEDSDELPPRVAVFSAANAAEVWYGV